MVDYDKIQGSSDIVDKIENASMDMRFDKWLHLVSTAFDSGELNNCQRVKLFGPPVEAFCVDDDLVEVVGTIDINNRTTTEMKNEVEYVIGNSDIDPFNMAIGIHETSMRNANSILDEGIKPWMESKGGDFSIRNGSVFFWPHTHEVGDRNHENPDGVVVACPAEHTMVSSYMNTRLLSEGYTTAEDYNKYHAIPYMDYVECIGNNKKPDMMHGSDTLF